MRRKRPAISKPDRPTQQTPAELLVFLLQFVRAGFYRDCPDRWFADQHFIRRKVLTWPAIWLDKRGVTLSPDRYKEILVGIFSTIKTHGNTESVRYWPGYLLHCVQEHFKHNEENIYEEAKSLRNKTEAVMLAFHRATDAQRAPDPVVSLVQVAAALAVATKKKKTSNSKQQLSLF